MNIKLKASWNFQHISKVVYPDHLKNKNKSFSNRIPVPMSCPRRNVCCRYVLCFSLFFSIYAKIEKFLSVVSPGCLGDTANV